MTWTDRLMLVVGTTLSMIVLAAAILRVYTLIAWAVRLGARHWGISKIE